MHDTAMLTGRAFFACYARLGDKILDVGSLDVNGSLRSVAPAGCEYIGIDAQAGPGVDVVVSDYTWSNQWRNEFDLAVSTSCFEHDPMFWLTFDEMVQAVKPGGFVYISAPANGPYHGHPGDCWRFYKDSGRALEAWANHLGLSVELIESFQMQPRRDIWIDQVMIFGKAPILSRPTVKEFLYVDSR